MRLALFSLCCCVCTALATPVYRLVDLGPGTATAINSAGAVSGWSVNPSTLMREAFLGAVDGGRAALAGSPAAAAAYGLNDLGTVAGVQYDAAGSAIATKWTGGLREAIGTVDSYAMAVNNSGIAAGSQNGRAVRFTVDGAQAIQGLGAASWSTASDIDSAGAVTGTAQLANGSFRAFTAAGSTATLLGTLGGRASYGQDINEAGWVVGGSTTRAGFLHAFVYNRSTMIDLGTLGGPNSSAYGVNDLGMTVGYSLNAAGQSRAFLWQNGGMRDLNELVALEAGWRLAEASAINNAGQITGYGYWNGAQRAFRLDPIEELGALPRGATSLDWGSAGGAGVPEAGTWQLVVAGLAAIAAGRFHTR
jgi:probable HAF family extracellular repeat protein